MFIAGYIYSNYNVLLEYALLWKIVRVQRYIQYVCMLGPLSFGYNLSIQKLQVYFTYWNNTDDIKNSRLLTNMTTRTVHPNFSLNLQILEYSVKKNSDFLYV